ncbi:hypothetical protein CR201_G0009415 [Pongo abelii]|uniref:Uncharacterized protein n=1 Tax=Pongo abelii TaxID=9601 RepID=A0A2J8WN63_PONAB|nr:hypothetical protein CR201_G0009415 [Pongo abelii]
MLLTQSLFGGLFTQTRMKFGAVTQIRGPPLGDQSPSSCSLLHEKDPPTTSGPQTNQAKTHLTNFKSVLGGCAWQVERRKLHLCLILRCLHGRNHVAAQTRD